MSAALTLPGDIPGLLRIGSVLNGGRVVIALGVDIAGERYAMTAADTHDSAQDVLCEWLGDIALDLTDKTGRAHAAWWAERANTNDSWPVDAEDQRATDILISACLRGNSLEEEWIRDLRNLCLRLAGREVT